MHARVVQQTIDVHLIKRMNFIGILIPHQMVHHQSLLLHGK